MENLENECPICTCVCMCVLAVVMASEGFLEEMISD